MVTCCFWTVKHARSFLRSKLISCLLLLLTHKPCSFVCSSVNLPTSLFQVESYNIQFSSLIMFVRLFRGARFFCKTNLRNYKVLQLVKCDVYLTLPWPQQTSSHSVAHTSPTFFYRGWDINPSPNWGGVGRRERGVGAGIAICLAFHPKEPAQNSWTHQGLRFQLVLAFRITKRHKLALQLRHNT